MFGGPFMNLLIGVVLFGVLLMGFGAPQTSTTVGTRRASACSPRRARARPAQSGDPQAPGGRRRASSPATRIVSIDGTTITIVGAVHRDHPRSRPGTPLTVVVERDGRRAHRHA